MSKPTRRRQGEGKAAARKRWKAVGRCQTSGKKMNERGRECSVCRARRNKRYGPPDRYR